MMKWYLPRSDNVIAVSKGLASEISQNTGFPHIKIHVIYNPIITDEARLYSLRRLNEKSHPARNKKFSIIFIGRLSQEKRIDVLIGAFNILHKEIDTKLTIIGDGPLRSDLELEASKSNGHIIFWGAMENPYQLLRKSDVLVLPSDFEGFGNVLVEAMSCGVQVIATDCPYGPREILDSGTLGQLIKCGDADDLAAALKNTYNREYWIQPKSLIKKSLTFTTKNSAEEYLYHMKIK
jgi:glycosyltransferase involved in cell wall biosynthesis